MNSIVKPLFISFLIFLISQSILAQEKRDEGFRSPLDIPLYLAGNFGELRSNHFHTGIDIKTQGVEGKAVYAIQEGYVSRIKISEGGYGKAIYIRHPNGYTSVYAHLLKGSKNLEAYIQNKQYQKESFTIELFPEKNELKVEKGELIAYSGNSGSSGGPHLHFEIRETNSEEPVNPLLFGFDIQDNIAPIIKGIRIYPMNESTYVSSYPGAAIGFLVDGNYGKYKLKVGQRIEVSGDIGLAIHTYDLLNGYPNKCGIYKIEMELDSELVFSQRFDNLNFSHLRYINTYMDYPLYRDGRKYYHKQFVGENNQLKIYANKVNNGILTLNDGKEHQLSYKVVDSYGNTSHLSFTIMALLSVPSPLKPLEKDKSLQEFTVKGPNYYKDEHIVFDLPPMALYNDASFNYTIHPSSKNTVSPIYEIGNKDIPLQKNFNLSIKNVTVPSKYRTKALVVLVEDDGTLSPMGGKWKEGNMIVKSRYFGKYAIAIDSIAPRIESVNIAPNKDMSSYNTFSLTITDDLSGIKSYRGTIDEQWILMEYDAKKDLLTYRFNNEKVANGEHQFKLFVKDGKGNTSTYEADFIR